MKTGVVPEFRGEYYFLSNYYTAPFMWRGIAFRSAEQAFAFAKCYFVERGSVQTTGWQAILDAREPGQAKKLGRALPIDVAEWDKNKVMYMREIIHAKFSNGEGDLVGKLINTGAMMLVEGNDWGDKFWGRTLDPDTGKMVGLNTLGVLLMEERGYWLYSDFGDKSD